MTLDEKSPPFPERQPSLEPDRALNTASLGDAIPPVSLTGPSGVLTRDDSMVPEDLRVPWGWRDLAIFAVLAVGATLVLSVFLVIVFNAIGIGPSRLQQSASDKSLWAIVDQALLFLVILLYLVAQMRLRFAAPFWRTIGWRPIETEQPRAFLYLGFVLGGFLLALVVQVSSARFGSHVKLPMETLFQDRRAALLLLLMAVLVAPVVEETIFRGYIYPVIGRSFGVGAGIVATGTLFGLLHAPQLWGGWLQIVLLVIVGIVFTYVRAVTKSVFASYILHVSYNSFVALAVLIGTHGLRVLDSGP